MTYFSTQSYRKALLLPFTKIPILYIHIYIYIYHPFKTVSPAWIS